MSILGSAVVTIANSLTGKERDEKRQGEKTRKGGESLDPAVDEGRGGRSTRRGACVGASRHFFDSATSTDYTDLK